MQTQEPINWKKLNREERGQLIFQEKGIKQVPNGWRVKSQSFYGREYLVKFNGHNPICNCNDCEITKKKCKHIHAVEFYIKQEINQDGEITTTKGVKVSYSQKWKAYNFSQTNEKLIFMRLLSDLFKHIEQPKYEFGRPKLPMQDMIFSSAMKVYSTFSLRRFISDIKIAQEKGYLERVCSYATVSNYMNDEKLTPILKELIKISSMPLSSVENNFAVDSSGFSTSRFARYFSFKHGRDMTYRIWIKGHLLSGTKSNIVVNAEITDGNSNDSPQLAPLIKGVSDKFNMEEVSCDKAYSSRENLKLIEDVGAMPFIPFKKNATGEHPKHTIWKKMYHYYLYNHEEFMKHYNQRSNSETVFHMIKTKFRDNLRSKGKIAQINELLLKVLCHNICVVIQEMSELGIKGEFIVEEKVSV